MKAHINYERVRSLREKTHDAYSLKTEEAKVERTAIVQLIDTFYKETRIRDHKLISDEPEYVGGTDKGPRPTELLLASLGNCLMSIMVLYAAAMRVQIDAAEFVVRGIFDRRGLMGMAEVRQGFERIIVEMKIESPEPEQRVRKLIATTVARCPVTDNLTHPAPVEQRIVHNGKQLTIG